MSKRVVVIFSDEVYEELQKIAKQRGGTFSDVLRDALTVEKYRHEMTRDGGRFLVERAGVTRELRFDP